MKAFPILLSALLLAACGKSEAPAEPAQNAAEAAPKPAFKVKYIDNNAIAGLDLGQSSEGKTNDGKKQISYPINGLSEQNVIQLIGNHPNDLEVISGKCMETGDKGEPLGWTENGKCHALFAKLVGNIAEDGSKAPLPATLTLQFERVQPMRYGENPHQFAAFYREAQPAPGTLATYQQLQGKELSYNNIADADAAWEAVKSFDSPACVIVKHANPCGVAIASNTLDAYKLAYATDTTSAFGGIIAFNREVDGETVKQITDNQFMEVLMAPKFTAEALEIAAAKKNVRVLEVPLEAGANRFELKRVGGGLLVQTPDIHRISRADLKVVSKRQPTEQEWNDLMFVWNVAKYVKSNAIVFGKGGQTYGIGAGQMSRVDSTRIAARKAQDAGLDLNGACAASDAFFPFRDGVDVIAEQGIKAIIHPAGSMRDQEVFDAADEHGIAMVVTGIRHFRH